MSKKRKHKNRHIFNHTQSNSNQGAQSMSPIATQPAPSSQPPVSPLARVAHLSIPAASILARFQVEFTAIVEERDPNDPTLRPWFEQYAMLQQAALCERLYNLFEENFNGGSEEVKFIRLLLQALTVQEKTASRRDRVKREADKQAREEAKKAKDQQRVQNAHKQIERAKETLDRLNNLNDGGPAPLPQNSALKTQHFRLRRMPECQLKMKIPSLPTPTSLLPPRNQSLQTQHFYLRMPHCLRKMKIPRPSRSSRHPDIHVLYDVYALFALSLFSLSKKTAPSAQSHPKKKPNFNRHPLS